ncbi:MAG TPA: cytochrome C oxidase subunit IV family protein [Polyangiaceae bacterium]
MSDAHAHGHADDGAVHVHIASSRFYWGIFGALVLLTIATVKVSYYDFGSMNTVIALLIATMKGSLVAAFFMHLRHDKLFNTIAFLAAFLFLAIFILLTYDDLGQRARVEPDYGSVVDRETGLAAPGGAPATSATVDEVEEEAPHAAGSAAPSAHPAEKPAEKKE